MSLPVKLGLATATLGIAGGLGYAGVTYFGKENKVANQGTSISELINKEYNHILLKTTGQDDNTYWDTNWTNYKKESNKLDKDIFGLEGWQKNSENNLTNELKAKCTQLANEVVPNSNDDNYKNVTKYCARDVTIKDQADKEQLRIISDVDGENNPWDAVAGKKAGLTSHFTNLKIAPASGATDIKGTDVKKGCEAALNKNKSESDYQTTYDSYKKVCVRK